MLHSIVAQSFVQLTGLVCQICFVSLGSLTVYCLGFFECVKIYLLLFVFSCIVQKCMLYYCNIVRWAWWDWELYAIWILQCFYTFYRPVSYRCLHVCLQLQSDSCSVETFDFDWFGWVIRPVKISPPKRPVMCQVCH